MNECLQTAQGAPRLTASDVMKLIGQPETGPHRGSHCVQFYDEDSFLIERLTDYVRAGLANGEACMVVATKPHREALAARLSTHGQEVANEDLGAQYYSFDAGELLSQFVVDDEVDPSRFMATVGETVRSVCAQGRTVRAFGEMVALLATGGNFQAAVQLEQAWNQLQLNHDFTLLCAYSLTTFSDDRVASLMQVCDTHSQIIPNESYQTQLQRNVGRVDVAAAINGAIESVQPAASAKDIEIEVTLDSSIPHISGDGNRLLQVIWNLLANAIKFAPSGGRVNVFSRRKAGYIQIFVSDNGQGIDPLFAPYVFDPFCPENAHRIRSEGGPGLGLSMVRHLVELHGGTVTAHSAGEGKGATFTISLPIRQPPIELPEPASTPHITTR